MPFRRNVEFTEKPRQIIVSVSLLVFICVLRYSALQAMTLSDVAFYMGLASMAVCVNYAILCTPDSPSK